MTKNKSSPEDSLQEEEDKELVALKALKQQLITEVIELKEALKEEERKRELEVTANLVGFDFQNKIKSSNRLVELSQRMLGVSFENVNKTLLHDDIYEYKATVVTQALHMFVKLNVEIKDNKNFEILDLDCYFPENQLDTCFLKEIEPWVNMFKETKKFSVLISVFVNYIEQSYLRNRILRRLEKRDYATAENCTTEEGGLLVHVHSPKRKNEVYFTIQWATRFLEKTYRIEHHFIIEIPDEESTFVEKNKETLKKFSHSALDATEVEEVWSELCNAIDEE